MSGKGGPFDARRVAGLVSVVVPAFNCAPFLDRALDSVLGQWFDPLEVIVIDDGSTDGTAEVARAREPDVTYHRQDNSGAASARNVGIRRSRGELIAFLDGDDAWPAERLARHVEALEADPQLDMTIGQTQLAKPGAEGAGPHTFGPPWFASSFGATVFRRRVFERVGLLDESLRTQEDLDWFIRAREAEARFDLLEFVSLFYYRRADSLSSTGDRVVDVVRRSLVRRRELAGSDPSSLPTWFPRSDR